MKMYTIDGALLTETPEIRLGDKVYPVDDRQKTVEKIMGLEKSENDISSAIKETFSLAFGKSKAKEIDDMNLPYPAYQRLFETVIAAITGENPEEVSKRFQKPEKAE